MFWHYSREGKTGLRAWWHFGRDARRCLGIELAWMATWCHVEIRVDDDGWTWAFGFPPFAIWISFDNFPAWKPRRKCIATWDNNREFWLTDQRESGVSFYDWRLSIKPWSKSMEWTKADPWWVRGVSFDFRSLGGKQRYASETLRDGIAVVIPMPEGTYRGVAKFERATWKRPRWFRKTRLYTSVDVPKGIPFAGKGENSWDCGDDGLFGYSVEGHDIPKAIAHGVESVLRSRKRNGMPSDEAIREALA